MAEWIKMPLGIELGLGLGDIVLEGTQLPLPKKGAQQPRPQFQPMYCGHIAGWIKMPLGTEVGLSPGNIVLDGDPAPPTPKGAQLPPPIFRPCLLWPNGRPSQLLMSTVLSLECNTYAQFGRHCGNVSVSVNTVVLYQTADTLIKQLTLDCL